MILTCPSCAQRFRVADEALAPAGRTVRCGLCRHTWPVDADGFEIRRPSEPDPEPEPVYPAEPAPPIVFDVPDEPLVAPPSRPAKRKRDFTRLRRIAAWAAGIAAVATVGAAIYFHEVVATEFAASRPVYRLVMLMPEMSSEGLALDNLRTEPELAKLDQAALPPSIRITGDVRNTSWIPRSVATLVGRLFDRRRLELNRWMLAPARRWLWPGETTSFASEVALDVVRPAELSIRLAPLD